MSDRLWRTEIGGEPVISIGGKGSKLEVLGGG
jgi:hypothetical protein